VTLRINARAPTVDHPLDQYWTPAEAVRALMAVERLHYSVRTLVAAPEPSWTCWRRAVMSYMEVIDYCWKGGGVTVIRNYLAEPVEMNGVGIVTNPPFRLAEAFIRKAIADGCRWRRKPLRRSIQTTQHLSCRRDAESSVMPSADKSITRHPRKPACEPCLSPILVRPPGPRGGIEQVDRPDRKRGRRGIFDQDRTRRGDGVCAIASAQHRACIPP
jgi:hypothetical protein